MLVLKATPSMLLVSNFTNFKQTILLTYHFFVDFEPLQELVQYGSVRADGGFMCQAPTPFHSEHFISAPLFSFLLLFLCKG